MDGIYFDEHEKYQIDLRFAIWKTDRLHEMYKTIGNELSDVDWIAETNDEIFLIEFKNTRFATTKKEYEDDALEGKKEFYDKICKKYYGSTFFVLTRKNTKPINFICVVEPEIMDSTLRKRATASIKKRLPFELQNDTDILINLINKFEILDINEWNNQYPYFPLKPKESNP